MQSRRYDSAWTPAEAPSKGKLLIYGLQHKRCALAICTGENRAFLYSQKRVRTCLVDQCVHPTVRTRFCFHISRIMQLHSKETRRDGNVWIIVWKGRISRISLWRWDVRWFLVPVICTKNVDLAHLHCACIFCIVLLQKCRMHSDVWESNHPCNTR